MNRPPPAMAVFLVRLSILFSALAIYSTIVPPGGQIVLAQEGRRPPPPGDAGMPALVPGAAIVNPRPPAQAICRPGSITCVHVRKAGPADGSTPLTFGQVFLKGHVPAGSALRGSDSRARSVPLQMDQASRFDDGSLRFAVISAILPALAPGETERIDLWRTDGGRGMDGASALPPPAMASRAAVNVQMELHSPQITLIDFGAYGAIPKVVPFKTGEVVTLEFDDGRVRSHSVVITQEMAGSGVGNFHRLSKAFQVAIEKADHGILAYKSGPGDGYGKLWVTTKVPAKAAFNVKVKYEGEARITVSELQAFRASVALSGNIGSGRAAEGSREWLAGPIANERDFPVSLISAATGAPHPHLALRVRWRAYPDAAAERVEIAFENLWAFEPAPQNWLYDVKILDRRRTIFSSQGVLHNHHSRWRRVFWLDGRDEPGVWHDRDYLLASGAFPPYDPGITVPERIIAHQHAGLLAADTGPMGAAKVTTYMPGQGGRADIGPLPQWAGLYLLTMDLRAKALLLANAEAGAAAPVHYRDKATGLPVSLDRHPGLAMGFGVAATPRDTLPKAVNGDTQWTPDTSHLPSLAFVPYLVTGDLYYFEEMAFWANWVMGTVNPVYREGAAGLLNRDQVRGQAWAMRTLAEAALFAPDADPLKAYFATRLDNNLAWYRRRYVDNPDPAQASRLGFMAGDELSIAPWMQDFMYLSIGHIADQGVAGAREFARWLARFSVGRWSAQDEGYCRAMAPAYYVKIRREAKAPFVGSMRELFEANWPNASACPAAFIGGYPNLASGYVAIGHATLALACGHGEKGACASWRRLREEAPGMVGDFQNDPTFAFAPRPVKPR